MPTKIMTRLLAGTCATALLTGAALAAEARPYDIPQQDAATALQAFAMQSGRQVLFPYEAAKGRTAPAVQGDYSDEQALAMLAASAGLRVTADDGKTVTLRPQLVRADEGGGGDVDALIVTAQKREEDIQDVPIAISAFSQEALETHQIAGGPDLITQVPNMTFTKTNFSSYSIQIRGIGTQAISATTDPGVAVAFNNTPFIQNRFFEQEFYDLQRVEVLRGPQGTLYGRNATAGVVNIISAKPKFIAEAKLSADVANYNSTRVEGMINIPLVEDMAALRLAGAWTKREGYSTNELTGNPIDGRDLWSTRASLRFAPTDALDVSLVWEHFEENDDRLRSGKQLCKKHEVWQVGSIAIQQFHQTLPNAGVDGAAFAGVQPTFSQGCIRNSLYAEDSFQTPNGAMLPYYLPLGGLGLGVRFFDPYSSQTQSPDLRAIESTVDPKYKAKADLGELQINWDVTDSLTLSSETGYAADFVWSTQDFNRFNTASGAWQVNQGQIDRNIMEPDGSFCDPQIGCSDRLVAVDLSTSKGRQFSQELRLSSDFDGPFNFSLGANFLRYNTEAKYYVFFNSLTLVSVSIASSFTGVRSVPYEAGVSDNHECAQDGAIPGDPTRAYGYTCIYIENNSIENIQDQGHNYFLSKNPYKLISYAMFGEAYYNITDNLKVTGGLRWTVDKKHAPRIPSWTLAGGGTRGYPVLEVQEQEWREPTGRLALDWKPDLSFTDETLLYASYAHGYKAGGANPPPMVEVGFSSTGLGGESNSALRPKTFDAEFVDAYELGAKNTLLDGRVTLNLAAFYYNYKDYQISEIIDRSAFNRNFDAEIWGLEIEADWRPLENLKLGFKGGYENTRIADGEHAIDLMDRTAGNPDWVVVRPFPTFASSCILPTALFTHEGYLNGEYIDAGTTTGQMPVSLGGVGGGNAGGCELAYLGDKDPVTGRAYEPFPTQDVTGATLYHWLPGTYPGWNPLDESVDQHNGGEGFFKDLGGNQLPNAPEFTATITADYTLPLPNEWLATLHTDLYWQAESWWRVFNDHEFNKLDEYFTMNLAAIFTNEERGWRVMAYVKNVFDRDSITGAFLNSDDTGLTTNVFLTEPRLYGLRVTKQWNGGPLLGGFGARHDGPYALTLELGAQLQRHDAPNAAVEPSFLDEFSEALNPLADQQDDLDWGDGRDVKLTWQPGNWRISLGARFGKTNGAMPWSTRKEAGDQICGGFAVEYCQSGKYEYYSGVNYTVSTTADREAHAIVDFAIGKDVGLGSLDASSLSAGIRFADLQSTTNTRIFGVTNWDIPIDAWSKYYTGYATHDRFNATLDADRSFKGTGPVLNWEASQALLGGKDTGVLGLDWSVSAGALFGRRKTSISGAEVEENFQENANIGLGIRENQVPFQTTPLPPVSFERSESVTVPTFGASLGLSYNVDRFAIGAGYRWERYQDAIDGGYAEEKEEDRTVDGPYFKVSVGFGG